MAHDDYTSELEAVEIHLSAQRQSVDSMLNVLDAQRIAIVAQDVDALVSATADMTAELARREVLDKERERLLGELAVKLECEPDEITAQTLASLAPEGQSERLRIASEQLRGRVDVLQARHEQVREMLRSDLAFVSHLMAALDPSGKAEAYHRPGHGSSPARTRPANFDLSG